MIHGKEDVTDSVVQFFPSTSLVGACYVFSEWDKRVFSVSVFCVSWSNATAADERNSGTE